MDGLLQKLEASSYYAQECSDKGVVVITEKFIGVVCEFMAIVGKVINQWSGEQSSRHELFTKNH